MIWTKAYSGIGILFALMVILFHILLFPEYTMPLLIILTGLAIIFLFFVALFYYNYQWNETTFIKKKLFLHSIIYRVLFVIGTYLLTKYFDPAHLPFEIAAIDSINYHTSGKLVVEALEKGESISKTLSSFWKGASDFGFSVVIGFLYYAFGAYPLVIKLFNTLIGSFTVIRVYQITKLIIGEKQARLAGILTMLMPPLLWFGSMVLKETLLIFIILNTVYLLIRLLYGSKFSILLLLLIIVQIVSTLYFRTFIAPLLLICILLQIVFLRTKKKSYKFFAVGMAFFLIYGSYTVVERLGMAENIDAIVTASKNQFGNELSYAAQSRGITYTTAVIAPLLIAGAVVTPFPSLLDFEEAQLGIYSHFFNEIIRNSLYFFVFLGLFRIYKHRGKGTILVSSFAIGYILVLVISGISFQDRFQILALPFLIIFMADGITHQYPKKILHWKLYLALIFFAIISWNLFKLSNRGLL